MRLMLLPMLLVCIWISSCGNQHKDEIAACENCDSFQDLVISPTGYYLDTDDSIIIKEVNRNGRDTSEYMRGFDIAPQDQQEVIINKRFDTHSTFIITIQGTTHVYSGFKMGWIYMANKWDHYDGVCRLQRYAIDGDTIAEPSSVLLFP